MGNGRNHRGAPTPRQHSPVDRLTPEQRERIERNKAEAAHRRSMKKAGAPNGFNYTAPYHQPPHHHHYHRHFGGNLTNSNSTYAAAGAAGFASTAPACNYSAPPSSGRGFYAPNPPKPSPFNAAAPVNPYQRRHAATMNPYQAQHPRTVEYAELCKITAQQIHVDPVFNSGLQFEVGVPDGELQVELPDDAEDELRMQDAAYLRTLHESEYGLEVPSPVMETAEKQKARLHLEAKRLSEYNAAAHSSRASALLPTPKQLDGKDAAFARTLHESEFGLEVPSPMKESAEEQKARLHQEGKLLLEFKAGQHGVLPPKIEAEGTVDDVCPPAAAAAAAAACGDEEDLPSLPQKRSIATHFGGVPFRKGHKLKSSQEYRCCNWEKYNCMVKTFVHDDGNITSNDLPHTDECLTDAGLKDPTPASGPTGAPTPDVTQELTSLVKGMAETLPRTMLAKDVAKLGQQHMNDTYGPRGWKGPKLPYLEGLVRRERKKVNGGDALAAVEAQFMDVAEGGDAARMRFNIKFFEMDKQSKTNYGKHQRVIGFSDPRLMTSMKLRNVSGYIMCVCFLFLC